MLISGGVFDVFSFSPICHRNLVLLVFWTYKGLFLYFRKCLVPVSNHRVHCGFEAVHPGDVQGEET
mgnify:CR=1 FL=1